MAAQRITKGMLQRKLDLVGQLMGITTRPVKAPKGSPNDYKYEWLGLDNGGGGYYQPVLHTKKMSRDLEIFGISGHEPARDCYHYLKGFADGYEMAKKGRRR